MTNENELINFSSQQRGAEEVVMDELVRNQRDRGLYPNILRTSKLHEASRVWGGKGNYPMIHKLLHS